MHMEVFYPEVLSGKGQLIAIPAALYFLQLSLIPPFPLYRIIRAFLVEEQKIVKKVLKIQKAKEKQAAKS